MPSNFKVLAGASGEPIDPNFRNVTLLLHGDGNNGGQNNAFVDSSSNHFPISRNGNTTQGSFSPYGSNWSIYSDGTGDCITVPSNAAFAFGTGDFTIEFWMYLPSWTSEAQLIGAHTAFSGLDFLLQQWNSGEFRYLDGVLTLQSGYAPPTNQWNHVAVTRSGTTVRIFVNGVQRASGTSTANIASNRAVGMLGDTSGAQSQIGYMSNVRIVKGTALYTTNFTPSTSPLTAVSGTSLLTCAYNRFRDGSTNNFTVTSFGNVKITNFAPFAPSSAAVYDQNDVQYWSGAFDGTGDYLTAPSDTAFAIGTGQFTLECWIYFNTVTNINEFLWADNSGTASGRLCMFYSGGNLEVVASGGAGKTIASWTPVAGRWYHIAATRDESNNQRLFVDGVLLATATSTNNYTENGFSIARAASLNGYMSNVRLVKGTAVYTSNFTPPTSPLTAISGTSLLTCQNASFTDNSANKFAITANGNATVVGNSPYNPVGYWSNSFDGSGDYLSIPNNAALNMAGSTFTLECWIYPNGDYSDYRTIMSKRNASTTSYQMFLFQTTGYLSFSRANTAYQSSATPTANTWNHVAAVYDGTNINLYLNGTRVLQTAVSIADTTDPLLIGAIYTGGENFNGHISNARVLKGVQAYSGTTYTVPTTPLTAISGTSLLTCQANRFIDSSANAFTITRNGDVAVRDFDPFTGANVTSTGGSAYFDGNGDYLRSQITPLNIRTAFTIDGWAYLTTVTNFVFFSGSTTAGSAGAALYLNESGGTVYFGDGVTNNITFVSSSIPINSWVHIACTFDGTTYRVFINGTSVGFSSTLLSNFTLNGVDIGARLSGITNYTTGYISGFRITGGAALYTSAFTPPSAPVNPTFATTLLLNATNAAIFDNSMKNNLETVGNAQISTSVKKFGTGSMYFDGSGDWLDSQSTSEIAIGGGDFTIEAWIYPTGVSGTDSVIFDFRNGNAGNNGPILIIGSGSGNPLVYVAAGAARITGSGITLNTWSHVAVSRSGTSTKMFLNGTQTGSTYTDTNNYASPVRIRIGADDDGSANAYFIGYMDEFRVTKGVARYTANFTAPTAPFPNK